MNQKLLLSKTEQKLTQKKYSKKTKFTYLFYLEKYFNFLKNKKIKDNQESIKKFLDQKKQEKISVQTYNLILNILKFYVSNVQANLYKLEIKYQRSKVNKVQNLTRLQIEKILNNTNNQKHYLIFALSFGAGLKTNEIINLRNKDIDFDTDIIKICNNQGKKLRETILPNILKTKLMEYIKDKNSTKPLFCNTKNQRLSSRSVQQAFQRAVLRAKIKKNVSFQSLRHSFASQVLQSGVDSKSLQKAMGLKNIRSIYKYRKNIKEVDIQIKSPLQ